VGGNKNKRPASEGGRYKDEDGRVKPPLQEKKSGGGFGTEDALETRASELDADEFFFAGLRIADVDDAAVSGEV